MSADGLHKARERGRFCVEGEAGGEAAHEWQPVSFALEVQQLGLRDSRAYRAPDIDNGRVWCVCMKCHKHTYIVTTWLGGWIQPFDFAINISKEGA